VATHSLEALSEAADDVEYQRAIGDGLAKIAESVCHVLELPAIVGDV
jgi:hypothetical protein